MARTVFRVGGAVDIPTVAEIRAEIEAGVGGELAQLRQDTTDAVGQIASRVDGALTTLEQQEHERARAVKWMRFPRLRGTIAGSAVSIGVAKGQNVGPESGYLWSIRRLTITGLTASATAPDIVNFYYTDNTGTAGPIWWQLNGNSFGTEWDMGGMMMRGGETLNAVNAGALTATGTLIVDWDGWEVPEELAWKLIAGG
jgi:hypothetical protein